MLSWPWPEFFLLEGREVVTKIDSLGDAEDSLGFLCQVKDSNLSAEEKTYKFEVDRT